MDDTLADQLKAEYLLLQNHYETFDARALMIKSWSTPLLATGLGLAVERSSVAIALVVVLAALTLWALEIIWKNFQYCYRDRIELLESAFDGSKEKVRPFQVFKSWNSSKFRGVNNPSVLVRIAIQPFVFLPYLPTAAAGLGVAYYFHQ